MRSRASVARCAAASGVELSGTPRLLKASGDYCEPVVSAVSESTATQLIKMGDDEVARGLIPASLVLHGMQMYGTMAVYLRLKGIVPPTTERQQSMKSE